MVVAVAIAVAEMADFEWLSNDWQG